MGRALAGRVTSTAERGNIAGQVALAWLLARGDDVVTIPGTKRVACVEEITAAADVVLGPDELERLEALSPRVRWAGEARTFGVGATSPPPPA